MNRQAFIDKLRVVAACAVVLLHTITGVTDKADMVQYPVENTMFLIIKDWIAWCVPVFIIISGYLFLNPSKTFTLKAMLLKYCRRVLLALFLFGVPFACMELIMDSRSFDIQMLGRGIIMVCKGETWSHMWYLYMILLLYIITPFLKWLFGRTGVYVPYGVLAFLLVGSSILPFLKCLMEWEWLPVLPAEGIYLFYYICGYMFVRKDSAGRNVNSGLTESRVKSGKKIGIGMMVLLLIIMAGSRFVGSYHVFMAYNYPLYVMMSILIVWVAWNNERISKKKNTTRWKNLGGLCFTIYLVHPVFLNLFYKLFHISPLDYPVWFSLPLIYGIVVCLSVLTSWFLCRIPLLKKYVL